MSIDTENIPSAPSLPPDLALLFSSLSPDSQRLYVKTFKHLWDAVAPARRFVSNGGVLYAFWLIDLLRNENNLTTAELSALTYLYFVTNNGRKTVKSELVYNGMVLPEMKRTSKTTLLYTLKRKGYIVRLNRDPSLPFLQRSIAKQNVFIQMTGKGILKVQEIEKSVYRLLLNNSYNKIIGVKLDDGSYLDKKASSY